MIPHTPESSNDNPPAGFDSERYPILARHWPGLPEPTAHVRRTHLVEHLHQLGPRPTLEFIAELAAEHGIANDVDRRLEKYGELDPETVALVGGRHIPPSPLVAVPR